MSRQGSADTTLAGHRSPAHAPDHMSALTTQLEDLTERMRGLASKVDLGSIQLGRRRSAAPRVVTGLDIEPGQVIAAEVHLNGRVSVERAAGVPLASDVVRDGEVADLEGLTDALRTLFAEHKLARNVRVGVANQRIIVRTVEFPPIADARELDAAVRFRAQDEIPMPPDTIVLDYQSLGVVDTMSGPRQRVVLVAARRDMIERLLAAVEGAGLRPEGIDLAAFALIRALHVPGADPEEQVLHLHISGLTNLVVAKGTSCVFTRVLGTGLEAMATTVAERCAISSDEARALLFRVGLAPPAEHAAPVPVAPVEHAAPVAVAAAEPVPAVAVAPTEPGSATADERSPADSPSANLGADSGEEAGPPAPPPISEAIPATAADTVPASAVAPADAVEADQLAIARSAVADGIRLIIAEVRNTLDYHLGVAADRGVARVVLSGPAAGVPGLVDALTSELRLPMSVGEVGFTEAGSSGLVPASRLAIAAGLAVNEVAR